MVWMRAQASAKAANPARWRQPRSGAAGFTLIELLIAVTISLFLAVAAAPTIATTVVRSTLNSQVTGFVNDLRTAKREALKRSERVVMCRSLDPENAAPSCAGNSGTNGDWATGWIVFVDIAHAGAQAGQFNEASGDILLRVHPAIGKNSAGITTDTPTNRITIGASGMVITPTEGVDRYVFKAPTNLFQSTEQSVAVCVNLVARVRALSGGGTSCG